MYEFIILGQLMHGPAHGYLIAKIINDIIGPYARISYGRLYPLLAKLEQNGLIAVDTSHEVQDASGGQRDRQLRIYKLTDAGRLRFQVLMSDTGSNPGDYRQLFGYKVTAFGFIAPADRLRLIDHYINYCQAHVFFEQNEVEDLIRKTAQVEEMARETPELAHGFPHMDASSLAYTVKVMQHSIEVWQAELDWARSLRDDELTNAQQADRVDIVDEVEKRSRV